jgi:single-stranded DNA-specific DHH superfamily exonuclease
MQFIIGSKEEFINFINEIKQEDNIAILTHTDLDGIASGIFLERVLKSKNLKTKLLKFGDYKNDILKKLKPTLNKEKISKLFILDMAIDSFAFQDFEKLRNEIDIFLIDHHPSNPLLNNYKCIIKGETSNCAAQIINFLGKVFTDFKDEEWLLIPTMISEFSFKNQDNLKLIQKAYPNTNEINIFGSGPGKIYEIITNGIIYLNDNLKKVYDLVSKKELIVLEKYHKIINEEIEKEIESLWKNAEYYKEKKLYFYFLKPKHRIKAIIATKISLKKPECSFILVTEEGDKNFLNVSARNQSMNRDMNKLMKQGIEGLENANGGGHVAAAGARFAKKDLSKFKENLLK